MALFRRKASQQILADVVYTDGVLYTLDAGDRMANALCCKDGRILFVGSNEEAQVFIGPDTEIISLEGRFATPGLIDMDCSPTIDTMDDTVCLYVDHTLTPEDIGPLFQEYIRQQEAAAEDDGTELAPLPVWIPGTSLHPSPEDAEKSAEDQAPATENPVDTASTDVTDEAEDSVEEPALSALEDLLSEELWDPPVYFGYGFSAEAFEGFSQKDRLDYMDRIVGDRCAALLSSDGYSLLLSSAALALVQAAALEEGLTYLTVPFALSVLSPLPPEALASSFLAQVEGSMDAGFTAVFDGPAPDFLAANFKSLLLDLYQSGYEVQRYLGALYMERDLRSDFIRAKLQQYRTNANELNGLFCTDCLYLSVDAQAPSYESLVESTFTAAEQGANIVIAAYDEAALIRSCQALYENFGDRPRDTHISLLHDLDLEKLQQESPLAKEESLSLLTSGGLHLFPLAPDPATPEEELHRLTIDAATQLGLEDFLGTLEEGKVADLTLFDIDPLAFEPEGEALLPPAALTIVNGKIVPHQLTLDIFDEADQWFEDEEDI